MSDWGKLLLWMLKTMPWIVCLISAFLAFFPESLTPDVFLPIRQEWGGWLASLTVPASTLASVSGVFGIFCCVCGAPLQVLQAREKSF